MIWVILFISAINGCFWETLTDIYKITIVIYICYFILKKIFAVFRVKKMKDFDSISYNEFKKFCSDVFLTGGFRNFNMKSIDNTDLSIVSRGYSYVANCKQIPANKLISKEDIRNVYSKKIRCKADYAGIITNGYFSEEAVKYANILGVLVWDRNYLLKRTK